MLLQTEVHWVLDTVLSSTPTDWETVPSDKWLESVNRAHPKLRLRLTSLPSGSGGSAGHLVVELGDQRIGDDWGVLDGRVYLPWSDTGTITTGRAMIWSLVHKMRSLGDLYDASFERSGLIVE
jgi:hypothetical protein